MKNSKKMKKLIKQAFQKLMDMPTPEFKKLINASEHYTNKSTEDVYMDEDALEFRSRIRSLFWNLANQREKVSSNLTYLIDELYPDFTAERRYDMKQEILTNIDC